MSLRGKKTKPTKKKQKNNNNRETSFFTCTACQLFNYYPHYSSEGKCTDVFSVAWKQTRYVVHNGDKTKTQTLNGKPLLSCRRHEGGCLCSVGCVAAMPTSRVMRQTPINGHLLKKVLSRPSEQTRSIIKVEKEETIQGIVYKGPRMLVQLCHQ